MYKNTFFLSKPSNALIPYYMSNVPFLYSKTPDNWRSCQNSLSSSLTLKQLSLVTICSTKLKYLDHLCCINPFLSGVGQNGRKVIVTFFFFQGKVNLHFTTKERVNNCDILYLYEQKKIVLRITRLPASRSSSIGPEGCFSFFHPKVEVKETITLNQTQLLW